MPASDQQISFHFRHFKPEEDLPRLLTLLAETEAIDRVDPDISEATVRDQLTWSGHDPISDRWVVEDPENPNRLIAWSSLWKSAAAEHADILAAVHPDWRCQGIGNELLAHTLTRARERGATYMLAYAYASHQQARTFLHKRGFSLYGFNTRMHFAGDTSLPPPLFPEGYQVRRYQTVDDPELSILLKVQNRSYQGIVGHRDLTREELSQWTPALLRNGTFLAITPDGAIVGFCKAELREPLSTQKGKRTGYINSPGVVPEHRHRDLYISLLGTAIHWFYAQGITELELESWGDDKQILEAYQNIGFTIAQQEIIYHLDIRQEMKSSS